MAQMEKEGGKNGTNGKRGGKNGANGKWGEKNGEFFPILHIVFFFSFSFQI